MLEPVWQTDTQGGFADSNNTADFNFDDETNTALYIAFEHPVPFLPNVKVNHTTLDNSAPQRFSLNSLSTANCLLKVPRLIQM